ncbi:MAG: ATP-binding protein [Treponemataceae bacterium]
MKLRAKLVLLVAGLLTLFIGAIPVSYLFLAPLSDIQRERTYYETFQLANFDLRMEANALAVEPLYKATLDFWAAKVRYESAVYDLRKIERIPKMNRVAAEAADVLNNLGKIADDSIDEIITVLAEIKTSKEGETLIQLLEETPARSVPGADSVSANLYGKTLLNSISDYNKSCGSILQSLDRQLLVIDAEIFRIRRRSYNAAISVVIAALMVSLFLSFFFAQNIARVLRRINTGIAHLSEGDFEFSVGPGTKDELGEIAANLGILAERLRERERFRHELENSVAELKRTRIQAVEVEKMATIGVLVSNLAHELNSPLGAIASGTESIKRLVTNVVDRFETICRFENDAGWKEMLIQTLHGQSDVRTPLRYPSRQKREFAEILRKAGIPNHAQSAELVLGAGLPLDAEACVRLLSSPFGNERLNLLSDIANIVALNRVLRLSVEKSSAVISSLEYYRNANSATELKKVSVAATIEDSLRLYRNWFEGAVHLTLDIPEFPDIRARPEELVIIWTNLIKNALQAMRFSGRLEVTAKNEADSIVVTIRNDGPGIAPEIREKLFTPFFTTKQVGEGVGLGLYTAKKLVQRQGGSISVESGENSTAFIIRLPIKNDSGGNRISALDY